MQPIRAERRGRDGAAMSLENPKAGLTEAELIYEADRSAGGGAQVESRRRLRVAVERLSLVTTWLTVAIIVLMIVQILVAVVKVGR